MKNKTYSPKKTLSLSKGILAVLCGLTLYSCGSQLNGYSETDGIYYDPNSDKIEQSIAWEHHQRDKNNIGIIEKSQKNQQQQTQRYGSRNWGENQKISTSDWGSYVGTQNNYYYDNYSWGRPFYYNDFYSPYYFGRYNSYFGPYSAWNIGWGNTWGTHWGYGYYSPFHSWYDPFYSSYYYAPYHYNRYHRYYYNDYYSPYYYPQRRVYNYKRSGVDNEYSTQNSGTRTGRYQQQQIPQRNYPNYNNNEFRNAPINNNNSNWNRNNNYNSGNNGGNYNSNHRSGASGNFRSGGFR